MKLNSNILFTQAAEAKIKISELAGEKVSNTERLAVIKEEEEVIHKEREERRAEEREESEKKRVRIVESCLSFYLHIFKGVLHPKFKISMFCVLSKTYQHFFEK